MKSSKGKARPRHREVAQPRSRRVWLLASLATVAAIALALFLWREDPRRLLREGEALLAQNPHQAGVLLERAIAAAGGDYPSAQWRLCEVLGQQGRWVEALGGFSLIQDKSGIDGRRLLALSQAAFQAGELILAEQTLEVARQNSRTANPEPAAAAPPAAVDTGESQATVTEAEVLQALIPVRLALGREERALAECRQLGKIAPDSPLPHATEARLLRGRREVLAAGAAYRAALARTRDPAESNTLRRELVEILIQEGNVLAARSEFEQLPAASMGADQRSLLLAYILRLEQRGREALEQVEKFLATHPAHADAALLRGTLYVDVGEYERAAVTLRELTERQPYHKEAHYLLGRACLKLGQTEMAKSHLERSQKLSALAQEIVALEERLSRERKDPRLYLRLAELYEATGRAELGARLRAAAAGLTRSRL